MPSGRSTMLTDRRVGEDQRQEHVADPRTPPSRQPASVTASAADPISTSTPVAYAPPCAFDVRVEEHRHEERDRREDETSGRCAFAHSGAMP